MLSPRKLLAALFLLSSFPLAAQTTGSVSGRVTDTSGGALPGVTVEAKSSALQGTRNAVTDAGGIYRLPLLPPGDYNITYVLSGFASRQKKNIDVGLGKEVSIDLSLTPAVSGEITVSADAPVIDTSSASLGTNLNTRAIETLPTGRNY